MAGNTDDPTPQADLIFFRSAAAELQASAKEIFEGHVLMCDVTAIASSISGMSGQPVRSALVRFEPGGRTRFHTHAGDQLLIIVEGRGHIGTRRRDIPVEVGDVVVVPAGLAHYHGAGDGSAMAHLMVLFGDATDVAEPHGHWPPKENDR
jgi:quercetin dioxygenase-like cupin family protein